MESAAERQVELRLRGDAAFATALGEAYKSSGYRGFLLKWLDRDLREGSDERDAYGIAILYTRLGKKEEALNWLERAYAAHTQAMLFLKSEPAFGPLHSDQRFQSILRQMKFPE